MFHYHPACLCVVVPCHLPLGHQQSLIFLGKHTWPVTKVEQRKERLSSGQVHTGWNGRGLFLAVMTELKHETAACNGQ